MRYVYEIISQCFLVATAMLANYELVCNDWFDPCIVNKDQENLRKFVKRKNKLKEK